MAVAIRFAIGSRKPAPSADRLSIAPSDSEPSST
jgi:hypothetical protein